jgi:C1A family cysteine protease
MTWEKMDAIAAKFRARTFRLSHLEEIPQQLKQGRPVLAKVELTDAWTTDKAAKSGQISVTGKEKFLGDYVVVIVGFDPADSSIKFANSWGVNWGENGFGKMSAESARRALKEMWAIEVPPLKN